MLKLRTEKGFTLIELMIVVAIIGILAAIAVPNFIAYRNKSRIAAAVATSESIRGAMAGHAAVSEGNTFPETADLNASWINLQTLSNRNGATLAGTALAQGFAGAPTYEALDSDMAGGCSNAAAADNPCADYYFIFQVSGVPSDLFGSQIEMRPSGIYRQSY